MLYFGCLFYFREVLFLMEEYIVFERVSKSYTVGDLKIDAVSEASFSAAKGEFTVIVGASGAGKTTVLNMLGGMDRCSSGKIFLDGCEISAMSQKELVSYRRYDVGFVFQFYNLMQNLTALENVEIAAQICRDPLDAAETLRAVGLSDRIGNFPAQLSGGEQQRVAIARAIAKNPKILLCDEPTGALDFNTGAAILKLLQDICKNYNKNVIVITHNQAITPMADKVITMRSGRVQDIVVNPDPVPIEQITW